MALSNGQERAKAPSPVKLSRDFVEGARVEAEATHRLLAAQVEHWATLGRAVERVRRAGRTAYGTDPSFPGLLVRIEPDGTRTPGRFVNRRFVPAVKR